MGRARTRSTGAVAVCAAVARVVAVAGPRVWLVGVVERGVVGPGDVGVAAVVLVVVAGTEGLAGEVADEADGVAWVGPVAPVGAATGPATATVLPGRGARRRVLTGPGYVPGARVWDPRRIRGQPPVR